jgi:uncharacterized membrane protein YfcA
MENFSSYLLLFLVGCVAGTLNVVAGGGSFLTLPVLIFMGYPAIVANGTNRVGLLFQNLGAVWGFHRHRVLDWQSLAWAAFPAGLGSLLGVALAFSVGDDTFKLVLAFLMVAITLWSLWSQTSECPRSRSLTGESGTGLTLFIGFLVVGIYGGFVQAGVGFIVLALTTHAGLDLVRGNAIKVLSILLLIIVSLSLFAWHGKVDWPMGLVLGAGTLLGGQIGVKLIILKGHKWIRLVVTITIILFAFRLAFV